jgi:hypothetical protein
VESGYQQRRGEGCVRVDSGFKGDVERGNEGTKSI